MFIFKWYYDQIFTPWILVNYIEIIPYKIKNAVYCLQISALGPVIKLFEKCVKNANERTNDIIHSTKYYIHTLLPFPEAFLRQLRKFKELIYKYSN